MIPVYVTSTGLLYFNSTYNPSGGTNYIKVDLYTDYNCTTKATNEDFSLYMSPNERWSASSTFTLATGTYYLKLTTAFYDLDSIMPFVNEGTISLKQVSSEDRYLAAGVTTEIANSAMGTYLKVVIPKSGYLNIVGNQDTSLGLYDKDGQHIANSYGYLTSKNNYTNSYEIKAGTYYIYTNSYGTTYTIKYSLSKDVTLGPKKVLSIKPANMYQNYYVKIRSGKAGYITLSAGKNQYGNVTLCNGKKKALSKECVLNSATQIYSKVSFAVDKNTTYYLKVKSSEYIYSIQYSLKTVKERSGSKVSKAVSFRKGKSVAGLILPAQNKKDYYKIQLFKAQIVNLKITGNCSSGNIRIKVYSDKKLKKKVGAAAISYYGDSVSISSKDSSSNKKFKKGTYYIVVERKDAVSNGNYIIKWLK